MAQYSLLFYFSGCSRWLLCFVALCLLCCLSLLLVGFVFAFCFALLLVSVFVLAVCSVCCMLFSVADALSLCRFC